MRRATCARIARRAGVAVRGCGARAGPSGVRDGGVMTWVRKLCFLPTGQARRQGRGGAVVLPSAPPRRRGPRGSLPRRIRGKHGDKGAVGPPSNLTLRAAAAFLDVRQAAATGPVAKQWAQPGRGSGKTEIILLIATELIRQGKADAIVILNYDGAGDADDAAGEMCLERRPAPHARGHNMDPFGFRGGRGEAIEPAAREIPVC